MTTASLTDLLLVGGPTLRFGYVDQDHAQYATAQKDEYLREALTLPQERMKEMPATARRTLEQMKVAVKTENTGRTLSIRGIEADERQVTMTMEMPGGTTGPMRFVFSLWTPNEEEINRNPVLREWQLFAQRAYLGTDPAAASQKMMTQMPGTSLASRMIEVSKQFPIVLKMSMSTIMPRMANVAATAAGQASPAASIGGENSAFMELVMSLDELSDAEVPELIFQIPRNYSVVPIKAVLTNVFEKLAPPKPAAK